MSDAFMGRFIFIQIHLFSFCLFCRKLLGFVFGKKQVLETEITSKLVIESKNLSGVDSKSIRKDTNFPPGS